MKRKLISVTLIAIAMLIPVASFPSGKPSGGGGGGSTTYKTTWSQTCAPFNGLSGTIIGSLKLSTRTGPIGSAIDTSCTTGGTSSNSGYATGSTSPSNWTWTLSNCLDKNGNAVVVSGKIGLTYVTYQCLASGKTSVSGQLSVVVAKL